MSWGPGGSCRVSFIRPMRDKFIEVNLLVLTEGGVSGPDDGGSSRDGRQTHVFSKYLTLE